MANAILEYLSVPVLVISIYISTISNTRKINYRYIIIGAIFIILFITSQLMPLPESTWKVLPFHDIAAKSLLAIGIRHPTGSLSLAPYLTWVSFLSFLPPLAIFVGALTLNSRERYTLIIVMLACGISNVFLGFLQFSQNSATGAYFYHNQNPSEIVGFFKNRNHFSALMYALIPFATAISAKSLISNNRNRRQSSYVDKFSLLFFGILCLFLFIVSCLMARSRAGLIILMVALVCISFIPRWTTFVSETQPNGKRHYKRYLIAIVLFSVLFAFEFGFSRLLDRFDIDPIQDVRVRIAKNTYKAAWTAFPYGTGLGTFQNIYAATEPVRDVVSHKFVNRAHNDYLEFILETGAFGLIIVLCFFIWYGYRLIAVWFSSGPDATYTYITRAASISIGLLLIHSFVDYPLRTQALMGLFIICCAILARDPTTREIGQNQNATRPRRIKNNRYQDNRIIKGD